MPETMFEAALLSTQDGQASASFAGPITDEAAVTFAAVLSEALAAEPRQLVVNLRRASSVNRTAVAVLNAVARHADANDIHIVIRDPDDTMRRDLTALDPKIVTVEPE